MPIRELITQATEIRPGDHLVALYEDEKEIAEYITSYIHASLSRNERCLYITGDVDTSIVIDQIHELSDENQSSGDLIILDKNDLYSKSGKFSPDKLINAIKGLTESALDDGYSALSITGELSWLLNYSDGEDLIIEYEWKLNEYIFNTYPVSALCRYNLNKFSDEIIRNIIQLHPIILWQNNIHENPYYIPPEGFKNRKIAEHEVKTWLKNIYSFTDTKTRFKTIVEKNEEEIKKLHKNMTSGIIQAFLNLLETHDPYTKDHCSNVARLASKLANKLELGDEFSAKIHYAALIHDIGKTIIPNEILNKPGKLDGMEFDKIKMHPIYGSNSLSQLGQFVDISKAIRHHHENYDGSGYPDMLKGEKIPLMSRIISVCDSYDAITNDRPYRLARTHEYAISEINSCAGKQYDPTIAKNFIELFD